MDSLPNPMTLEFAQRVAQECRKYPWLQRIDSQPLPAGKIADEGGEGIYLAWVERERAYPGQTYDWEHPWVRDGRATETPMGKIYEATDGKWNNVVHFYEKEGELKMFWRYDW